MQALPIEHIFWKNLMSQDVSQDMKMQVINKSINSQR